MVRYLQPLVWLLLFLGPFLAAPGNAQPVTSADQAMGTVTGTLLYEADAKRPWRQARYYVKEASKGHLAEAVVALDGDNLGKLSAPPVPETAVIDQKNFQFTPETIAIRAGDRVKFLNSDKELHNVNAAHRLHSFNVNMPAGGQHIERFENAGNIKRPYYLGCVYHGAMHGWIYVFDHPFFQLTAAEGRFRFEKVPPGRYRLEMVHPAGQLRWSATIDVQMGQVAHKDIRVSPDNQFK